MSGVRVSKSKIAISSYIRIRINDALTVWSEYSNTILPCSGNDFLFKRFTFGTNLFKSCAVDDNKLNALFPAVFNRIWYKFAWDTNVSKIDVPRNIKNGWICFDASYFICFRINGIYRAFIFIV